MRHRNWPLALADTHDGQPDPVGCTMQRNLEWFERHVRGVAGPAETR